MLCQNCKLNQATTEIKQNINGEESELHLCSECAANLGYLNAFSTMFGNFYNSFEPMFDLKSLFGLPSGAAFKPATTELSSKHCDFCNSTLADVMNRGRVGCANCYDIFGNELSGVINRMHPSSTHKGKTPLSPQKEEKEKSELDILKEQMEKAVASENFEEAATLRDKIKELEKKDEK